MKSINMYEILTNHKKYQICDICNSVSLRVTIECPPCKKKNRIASIWDLDVESWAENEYRFYADDGYSREWVDELEIYLEET